MNIRKFLPILSGIVISFNANAQSGCTDPQATNYNPSATTNDGSCVYPVTYKTPALRAALNPIILESSGIIWTDGQLWTHNDSGNPAEIYRIDTTDGHTIQTVVIDNYSNVDWEDITADSNYIYIGDHGNNNGTRTNLRVLKVAKADITSGSRVHVNAQAISFSYTDQTSFTPSSTNNFDCEALISIRDSLYIFTKDRGDLKTRVYKMPKTPGNYILTPYTSYNVDGLITGADYNAATNEIVLIGYLSTRTNPFLWYLNDFQGDLFFSGNKRRIEIGSSAEWQTEGVAWVSANRLFISCEATNPPPASLYVSNNIFSTAAVKNVKAETSYVIAPNPAGNSIAIKNVTIPVTYRIIDIKGQVVLNGSLDAGHNTIGTAALPHGTYVIAFRSENGEITSCPFEKE